MSINWVPIEPCRWRRIAARLRAWRWRRQGGLSPRWQQMGAIDITPGKLFLCSKPTDHGGPCERST